VAEAESARSLLSTMAVCLRGTKFVSFGVCAHRQKIVPRQPVQTIGVPRIPASEALELQHNS